MPACAGTWRKLASFLVSPGYVTERMTIYLATNLTAGKATPMDDERIEARWFTAPEVARLIRTGTVDDAKTRSEEHTSELQSLRHLVCRLLLEKKNTQDT